LAKSRWQSWVASEPAFHKPGKLVFHGVEGVSESKTLPELMEVLSQKTARANSDDSTPHARPHIGYTP
jgi:hypothetical protein